MDHKFCEYVQRLDAMFFGITTKHLRRLAYDFAEKNKMEYQFNKLLQVAGKDWLGGLLNRNLTLSLKQPTLRYIARKMGFNKTKVARFYKNLLDIYDKSIRSL